MTGILRGSGPPCSEPAGIGYRRCSSTRGPQREKRDIGFRVGAKPLSETLYPKKGISAALAAILCTNAHQLFQAILPLISSVSSLAFPLARRRRHLRRRRSFLIARADYRCPEFVYMLYFLHRTAWRKINHHGAGNRPRSNSMPAIVGARRVRRIATSTLRRPRAFKRARYAR